MGYLQYFEIISNEFWEFLRVTLLMAILLSPKNVGFELEDHNLV
jgi:hypothetical protein